MAIKEVGQGINVGETEIPDNDSESVKIISTDAKAYVSIDTSDGAEFLALEGGGSAGQRLLVKAGVTQFAASGYMAIMAEDASATNPVFCPSNADTDTGIGRAAADQLSFIAGGVEIARCVTTNSNAEFLMADEVGFISDPDCMIRHKTGNSLEFRMAGTDVLGVDGSGVYVENGNFGVGTLTPATKFECNGAAVTIGAIATALTGTFTATNGSTAISSGSSTAFTTELHVGSAIKIGSEGTYTVAAIASATALTLDSNFTGSTGASKSGTTDGGELFAVKTGDSKTLFAVDGTGAIQAGSAAEDSSLLNNITIGDSDALDLITTGKRNYVIGHATDNYKFTSGYRNVTAGFAAGEDTATAWDSVYIGAYAGQEVNANYNTYAGANAGQYASGTLNVAVGREALKSCTGANNVAVGAGSLVASGSAASCVAVGVSALAASTGSYNVAGGAHSLSNVDSGSSNTALGYNSGSVLEGGQKCIYIGKAAQASGADVTDEIAIGADLTGGGSNTARIGQSAVYMQIGIADAGTPSWAATSDARIKDNITDTDLGLDFINAIRAVKHTVKNTQEWPEELKPDVDKERQITQDVTVIDEDGNESVVQQTETIPPRPRHADNPTVNDGVIAQEIKAVCDAQGVTFSGWGEDTNGMQHIQYERFVMPLIKSVQQLSSHIETLTARVSELEEGTE